jgi:hypothetical protein
MVRGGAELLHQAGQQGAQLLMLLVERREGGTRLGEGARQRRIDQGFLGGQMRVELTTQSLEVAAQRRLGDRPPASDTGFERVEALEDAGVVPPKAGVGARDALVLGSDSHVT